MNPMMVQQAQAPKPEALHLPEAPEAPERQHHQHHFEHHLKWVGGGNKIGFDVNKILKES